MKSFASGLIENLVISHEILQTVRLLGEFKGKEALYMEQMPQLLESLRQVAIIQSTESSNRIEGVVAPIKRIEALVANKTTPRDRSEQEIAGYRDVLNTIHANHSGMPFTTGVILQLHRDLFKYTERVGGVWKSSDNQITEKNPDGTVFIRFQPIPACITPEFMNHLHDQFNAAWNEEKIDKLLLVPAYILDFLCIHPFLDGNGRMARLLTLLLLYKAGYEVGRFISLEKLIEDSRESYYEALYKSSQSWHEGAHNLTPWTEYLLGILIAAYREFENRSGTLASSRGAKTQMITEAIKHLPNGFRMAELERACPNVSREMIRKILRQLKAKGEVRVEGAGAGALWRKRGTNS